MASAQRNKHGKCVRDLDTTESHHYLGVIELCQCHIKQPIAISSLFHLHSIGIEKDCTELDRRRREMSSVEIKFREMYCFIL